MPALPLLPSLKVRVPRDLASVTTRADDPDAEAAAAGLSPADLRAIATALAALYRTGAYPALSFALRRRGRLVFNRSYGHAVGNGPGDPASLPKRLLTPDTPVCLFSASKAVTAVLVHKLAEDGGIRLEDPVSHYLPAFAQNGKGATTIRDVLAHRGRFPSIAVRPEDRKIGLIEDWDRIVALICAATPSRSRAQAYHAMTGGFILGEIIRRVTGQPISAYLDGTLRQPMQFRHFTYGLAEAHWPDTAMNYAAGTPVQFPVSKVAERALFVPFDEVVAASNTDSFRRAVVPAGNMFATAEELGRFFQMLLDGGVWEGRRILREATVARLRQPVGPTAIDRMLMIPMRYSEGMMLGTRPAGLYGPGAFDAFGHLGFMNILGWADPPRALSGALLTTGKAILGTHLVALGRLLATINRRCS